MSETRILRCSCGHPYQDQEHGYGPAGHNQCVSGNGREWRCTACGAEREDRAATAKAGTA